MLHFMLHEKQKITFHLEMNLRMSHVITYLMLLFVFTQGVFSQVYFQQETNYILDVTLDDKQHELSAFVEIQYINHSPDTLQLLYFHLWPNAYSNNQTALAKQIFSLEGKKKLFNNPELRGYIDSIEFRVNDLPVEWHYLPKQSDVCKITLNTSLLPGDTILITTPFHVKIPKGVTSRLGHIGETYQISQWYPKPTVYDVDGWHPMSYLDQGEFYSEFGRFEVNITLPDNYIVAATGELQNSRELDWLDTLAADTAWTSISMLGKTKRIASSAQFKTLKYIGVNMHDFAWFADKQFNVMKGKVTLPETGKEVTTWVMCTYRQAILWRNALIYANEAIIGLSKLIGDYPYPVFTVVQSPLSAGLGMEYPGLAVIGLTKNAFSLDEVITHEAAHSWFYGALGSNERRYPFLDEGTASNYEARYIQKKYQDKKFWEVLFKKEKTARFLQIENMPLQLMYELEWLKSARNNLEQPVNLTSEEFSEINYGLMTYTKASMAFTYLRAYLGDSIYDGAMQDYYQTWKFHHPQPKDLRAIFELHTNKDLNWFFDDLLGTAKRLDYEIVRLKNLQLLVRNKGEMTSPLHIAGIRGDSIYFEQWIEGFEGEQWIDVPQGNYTEIKIDPNLVMPELYRLNNNIRTSGIFPKADPFVPQLLLTIEDPEKRTMMYIPALTWNKESGILAGIAFHNGMLIPKTLEYTLVPFYSFKNSTLTGLGKITYNIIPYNNIIQKAIFTLEGLRFDAPSNQYFQLIRTGVELQFRAGSGISPYKQSIYGHYIAASDLVQINNMEKAHMKSYVHLGYGLQKTGIINPYHLLASLALNDAFQKASLELNYKFSYEGKDKGLDIRTYAGAMLKNTSNAPFYALSASGRSGRELYLYDGMYPDRFSPASGTLWSKQMTLSEGGLTSPVNEHLGYSKWLLSASISSSLPGILAYTGIKPFVNLLVNDHGLSPNYPSTFWGEAGFKITAMNMVEIYFPLIVTSNIQSIRGSIIERIRFVIRLDLTNIK